MPTFQDARNGLDKYLKDKAGHLSKTEKDQIIQDAARLFSRRIPVQLARELAGTGAFDYPLSLLAGFVEDFSDIKDIYFPFQEDFQHPDKLELKDYKIFHKASGKVLRFNHSAPPANTKALVQFSGPHTADPNGPLDTVAELTAPGTVLPIGESFSAAVDVESAADVQIFLEATAGAGTIIPTIQTSVDGVAWADVAGMDDRVGAGNTLEPLAKHKVSKRIRLKYSVTGAITAGARLTRLGTTGTLTIQENHMDVFAYLCVSKAARAEQAFYSHTVAGTLEGDTTDYEAKATFWGEIATSFAEKFDAEMDKITPGEEAGAFAIADLDIHGTTGWRYLTHPSRSR